MMVPRVRDCAKSQDSSRSDGGCCSRSGRGCSSRSDRRCRQCTGLCAADGTQESGRIRAGACGDSAQETAATATAQQTSRDPRRKKDPRRGRDPRRVAGQIHNGAGDAEQRGGDPCRRWRRRSQRRSAGRSPRRSRRRSRRRSAGRSSRRSGGTGWPRQQAAAADGAAQGEDPRGPQRGTEIRAETAAPRLQRRMGGRDGSAADGAAQGGDPRGPQRGTEIRAGTATPRLQRRMGGPRRRLRMEGRDGGRRLRMGRPRRRPVAEDGKAATAAKKLGKTLIVTCLIPCY